MVKEKISVSMQVGTSFFLSLCFRFLSCEMRSDKLFHERVIQSVNIIDIFILWIIIVKVCNRKEKERN